MLQTGKCDQGSLIAKIDSGNQGTFSSEFETNRIIKKPPIVDAISGALTAPEAEILSGPDPRIAPFQFSIRPPAQEQIEVACYALEANRYRQGRRPKHDHRFQIKYGSEFGRPHDTFVDPGRDAITLFIGVHLEDRVFIAADPAMHNSTWLSSSVEFKTHHLEEAKRTGWFEWARSRSAGHRSAGRKVERRQTETLVAPTPKNLLRFIQFELLATGLDAGERPLPAERMASTRFGERDENPLEELMEISARENSHVIWGRFRLEVAVRGGVAESHLEPYLKTRRGAEHVIKLDEDRQPDFELEFNDETYLSSRPRMFCVSREPTERLVWTSKEHLPQKASLARGTMIQTPLTHLQPAYTPITERWELRSRKQILWIRTRNVPGIYPI